MLLLSASSTEAHDADDVHRGITSLAVTNVRTRNDSDVLFSDETGENTKHVVQAAVDEDWPPTNCFYHGYNPYTGSGFSGWVGTALDNGKDYFSEAVSSYQGGGKEYAYGRLGRALHLLQDCGTSAHAHGASHVIPPHDAYEQYETDAWPSYQSDHRDELASIYPTFGYNLD